MHINTCKICGQEFEAASAWRRYCDKCRRKRRVMSVERYRKKHYIVRDNKPLTPEQIKERVALNQKFELEYRRKYCKGYDPENLNCIRCYENGTAEYKGCRQ